jgi:DNA modification methylase
MKKPEAKGTGQGSFCHSCSAWKGQLGLEPLPELYVEHLMLIFREVKRLLRKDGSFWLNIGDTYAGSWSDSGHRPERTGVLGHQREKNSIWLERQGHPQMNIPLTRQAIRLSGLQPKSMVCIPERVLFAMLADGWILRNKIIWHKPNNMPSSVKDRFTATWEYLYFFTKSRKYYFDLDAVRRPHKSQSLERYEGGTGNDLFGHGPNPQSFNLRVRDVKRGKKGTSAIGGELKASEEEMEEYEYPEKHHGSPMNNVERLHRDRTPCQDNIIGHFEKKGSGGHFLYGGLESPQGVHQNPKGKNPGDLWSITTRPSSISVCPNCETVFKRLLKVCPHCGTEGVVGHFAPYPETLCIDPIKASTKLGDTVLDIFAGGGTTGVAAKKLGRRFILIDCVRPYCIMARYKLKSTGYQPELLER